MSAHLTAHEVTQQLLDLSRQLDSVTQELNEADRDMVNKREDHTLALSKAFLQASGAMDLRRHQSIVDTHDTRIAAELAEERVRGLKRQRDTIQSRIDIGRSTGAAVRAEVSLAGTGTP